MRKKSVWILPLTLAAMLLPMSVYAEHCITASDSESSIDNASGSSDAGASVQGSVVTAEGDSLMLTDVSIDKAGNVTGLVVDETTTEGEAVERKENDETGSLETLVEILSGEACISGLSESVIDTIEAINQGMLDVPDVDLSDYHAVSETIALFPKYAKTQEEVVSETEVSIYTSAMTENGIDAVLFYDNYTQDWSLIAPDSVDTESGVVQFTIPCAGTAVLLTK
ncbi:MAG: hypothetical protein LUC83_04375 [Clostridiales bacterium]|nr:hypothetical protein [Clostridiales bacterium]